MTSFSDAKIMHKKPLRAFNAIVSLISIANSIIQLVKTSVKMMKNQYLVNLALININTVIKN